MKKFRALPSCLLLALSTTQAAPAGWKKVDTDDGVTVYEKDVGEMVAFRGEGQVMA
ncbi:MAG: hypothetical protein HOH25_07600, partial [Opitutae bacterium]|nr:hypothetical protein [Opitutae bacterium]